MAAMGGTAAASSPRAVRVSRRFAPDVAQTREVSGSGCRSLLNSSSSVTVCRG